ncbi:MAG: hypothetical protein ACXWMV_09275 [Syntrophales bacterium]
MKRTMLISLMFIFAVSMNLLRGNEAAGKATGQPMKKYVTEQATFVLYMPEGWKASEGVQDNFKTLLVSDPSGLYTSAMFYGISPAGKDVLALASFFANGMRKQYADLNIKKTIISRDKKKVVFDGIYSDHKNARKEFRVWIKGGDGTFAYSRIEAPEGKLAESKQLLLTILSNVRVMKGVTQAKSDPGGVSLVKRSLTDGSATVQIPQNWKFQSVGKGAFIAKDPNGPASFIVGTVEVLTPQYGTRVPGALVSNYLPPHQAMQFIAGKMAFASNMEFVQVNPRRDLNQQISQVYTTGPVQTEEFVYTYNAAGRKCKAYTFGISFGSRMNTNWKLWHITVAAPVEEFEPMVPNFVTMVQSYKINDQFAQNYIAQGMARLRQMQQNTTRIVSRNAQDIHQMMQAAYDERQKSMDYIDYQRTNYIRGTSDWISTMEGGTVYQSDRWGTKNTATGDYYEGQPYNYFNFSGKNPKYNEQMQEINSRELFERYKK